MSITFRNENAVGIDHSMILQYENNNFNPITDALLEYSEYNNDDNEYFICKNFSALISNLKKWTIELQLSYNKNSINSKKPFLIIGNCLQLYLNEFTQNNNKETYKIIIPKQFLNTEEDSIIYIHDFQYIKYDLNWLTVYFKELLNSDYYNPNNLINSYISSKNDNLSYISYNVKISGDIKLLKLPEYHIKKYEFIDNEFLANNNNLPRYSNYPHITPMHFSINRPIIKTDNTRRISFRWKNI